MKARDHQEDRAFRETPGSGPDPDPDRSARGAAAPWPALVGFVGLSLLLGVADAAAIPAVAQSWVLSLPHPPGMPPAGLIAPAWTVVSVPSGVAAWLVWRQPGHRRALLLWGWHLLACALWMQSLLALRLPGPALLAALALLGLVCLTALAFARLRHAAGLLLLPTLAWTCYALYVTAGLWWLNRG